jgi:hypothetical protein
LGKNAFSYVRSERFDFGQAKCRNCRVEFLRKLLENFKKN